MEPYFKRFWPKYYPPSSMWNERRKGLWYVLFTHKILKAKKKSVDCGQEMASQWKVVVLGLWTNHISSIFSLRRRPENRTNVCSLYRFYSKNYNFLQCPISQAPSSQQKFGPCCPPPSTFALTSHLTSSIAIISPPAPPPLLFWTIDKSLHLPEQG